MGRWWSKPTILKSSYLPWVLHSASVKCWFYPPVLPVLQPSIYAMRQPWSHHLFAGGAGRAAHWPHQRSAAQHPKDIQVNFFTHFLPHTTNWIVPPQVVDDPYRHHIGCCCCTLSLAHDSSLQGHLATSAVETPPSLGLNTAVMFWWKTNTTLVT